MRTRRLLLLVTAGYLLSAQPLTLNNSCDSELPITWNQFANAGNAWAAYMKDTTPAPTEKARQRYQEGLQRLTRRMVHQWDQLVASQCFTRLQSDQ
jgi:hypothetical protein